jgi:hypothetical protein
MRRTDPVQIEQRNAGTEKSAYAALQRLKIEIQRQGEELVAYAEKLAEADRQIKAMSEEIAVLENQLAEAQHEVEERIGQLSESDAERNRLIEELVHSRAERETLIEQHLHVDGERGRLIEELVTSNRALEIEISQRNEHITILSSELEQRDEATGGQMQRWPLTDDENDIAFRCDLERITPSLEAEEIQILYMFYHGYDLTGMCSTADLPPAEIFRKLQTLVVPPRSHHANPIELPPSWRVDSRKLCDAVSHCQFLFSVPVLDGFRSCTNIHELASFLTQAFHDLSGQADRDWEPMAFFVLEMAATRAVYVTEPYTAATQGELVKRLMSVRGRLLRRCRTLQDQHKDYVSRMRGELSLFFGIRREQLEGRAVRQEIPEQAPEVNFNLGSVVSSDSPVRADIVREMVLMGLNHGLRPQRYSKNLYHMAVVLLFRSRSAYEYLRNFLPFPAPSSIYAHFQQDLEQSAGRLKTVDRVEGYIQSCIAQCPEIAEGAVVAVDAVSCADTFVGMKTVEEGGVGYLFVMYLQPLTPKAKCSPLFVIESQSGMADDEILATIAEILVIVRKHIRRIFLATDGDPSYNSLHKIFMEFWQAKDKQWGLERVLEELKTYDGILTISDLLHLAKNFRSRFLRYVLTFTLGEFSKSTDAAKMRRILRLGAPLTDLSQLGKMRDAYPLVITRVEHIARPFDKDATAEAVVWLPLCLCFNAIRLDNITRETRLFMLRVSFHLVKRIYGDKQSGADRNPETSKKKKITLFTSQWSVRFLDTVLLLIFSIENYPSLAIDRESTQPLENFFGFVRMDSHDINTSKQMTNTIAHTDLVKESNRILDVRQFVPGRANLAGVHLDETVSRDIVYDVQLADAFPPDEIALICLKAVHAQEGSLAPDEQVAFLQFRHYLTLVKFAADRSVLRNEINKRFIFGSGSRTVRLITSHGTARETIGQERVAE